MPDLQSHGSVARLRALLAQGRVAALSLLALLTACGPKSYLPPTPVVVPPGFAAATAKSRLAHRLAPVLYLQRDETFPLVRSVAVVDTNRRIVAYHLLWRDDVHGAWLPSTRPTDEEIVWVGYSPSGAPTDVWTFWHGKVLHSAWANRVVEINVQWGKHGSLPRGLRESDLPAFRTLNAFYAATFLGLPDIWLGRLNRKGPWGFFHGYRRYREFTRPLALAPRLDAVLVAGPRVEEAMRLLFGWNYSRKRAWP
jgi:predicted small lipoprotein YifL